MTPPQIAVLRALSPIQLRSVSEIACLAFPCLAPKDARQRVYQAFNRGGANKWIGGERALMAMHGCAFSPTHETPRRWKLSPEGVTVRVGLSD
jgi:hypothetical protein